MAFNNLTNHPNMKNFTLNWCHDSSCPKIPVREDMVSMSSSVSTTPEFEEKKILGDADILYKSSSTSASKKQESVFGEPMMLPSPEHGSFFNHQSLLSHLPEQLHPHIHDNNLYYFSNNIFPTHLHQESFYPVYSNPTYPKNNKIDMIPLSHCSIMFSPTPSTRKSNKTKAASFKRYLNTEQDSFVCSVATCNKSFSRLYNLKSHMRIHTLERPFECPHKPCSWKFARLHDLKRHELQHTGQKPHHCRFCEKRFSRSDALKRHWKVDIRCAAARQEETRLNGGQEITYPRKKRSKKE